MSSYGVKIGGGSLAGWEHVEQSIYVILTTPLGSLVMLRDFGSRLYQLIDDPMNDLTKLKMFGAIADALARWEPRFKLENVAIDQATAAGTIGFILTGVYYPRGHLGDFTPAGQAGETIVVMRRANDPAFGRNA